MEPIDDKSSTSETSHEKVKCQVDRHDLIKPKREHYQEQQYAPSPFAILRDRVDALEVKTAEKSKPWYKTESGIIGIIATILSLASLAYTYFKDYTTEKESEQKTVVDNVQNILTLEHDISRYIGPDLNKIINYIDSHPFLQTRIEVYLNNIDQVKNDVKKKISPATFNYVANCYFHYSDRFDKAFEYFNLSLNHSKDALDSANAYLGIAKAYYTNNNIFFDTVKARQYFSKEVSQLKNISDKKGYFYLIKDFATIAAENEVYLNPSKSRAFIDSANFYLAKFKDDTNSLVATNLNAFIAEKSTSIDSIQMIYMKHR
jgi:tetratricopeptide (TPR) repeat protein